MHQRHFLSLSEGHLSLTETGVAANLNVATLKCESKARLLILDKVQCHLRVTFLLEVGNDRLANQLCITHHMKHLVVLSVDKRQLKLVLGRVNVEDARSAVAIEATDAVALDASDVDGKVECSNDAMVTAGDKEKRHICTFIQLCTY